MEQSSEESGRIPVAQVLRVIAQTMQQERGRLNGLSSVAGNATEGDRQTRAWSDAAYAVTGTGTGDAGEELQLAGQVLTDPVATYGRTARFLGQGLIEAGQRLRGRSGLSLADLGTVLAGLLAGAQSDNPANPGDGTLLDVLEPAVQAYTSAAGQGLTYRQATQGLLGGAMSGVRRTITMPQLFNVHPSGNPRRSSGLPDPGAAATQVMLTGLVLGLLGDRVPQPAAGQNRTNFLLTLLQQGIDLGGAVVAPPKESPVDSLLGGTSPAGRYGQALIDDQPGYGKGTDVRR